MKNKNTIFGYQFSGKSISKIHQICEQETSSLIEHVQTLFPSKQSVEQIFILHFPLIVAREIKSHRLSKFLSLLEN